MAAGVILLLLLYGYHTESAAIAITSVALIAGGLVALTILEDKK